MFGTEEDIFEHALMPANFRCQLAAIFCAATRTKAAEFLDLNNATACLDNLIKDFRKELNVFYDALAGWGHAPRAFD